MRRKGLSVWRLLVVGFLALNGVAIGLGHMVGPTPSWRRLEPVRRVGINGFLSFISGRGIRYLDLDSGEIERLPLPEGEELDQASWSPWKDAGGRSQVVGRWMSRSGEGVDRVGDRFGLARYSFPDGEPIDRISSEVTPSSPPCWLPGTAARVLFSGNDGGLYRFDFERRSRDDDSISSPDTAPRPLLWKCRTPGDGAVHIREPFLASQVQFANFVFVSLCREVREEGTAQFSKPELWWLRIDPEVTSILEAGRLIPPTNAASVGLERYPVVARGEDGRPLLAYFDRRDGQSYWQLRIAELDIADEVPALDLASIRVVAEDCLPSTPLLSADGRWVTTTFESGNTRLTRRTAVPRLQSHQPLDTTLAGAPRLPHS